MNSYYKNFILCGEIDYFCLLCEESFELKDQVEKHIRWEQHRKKIKTMSYVRKYKKEFIYKLGDKFYCEVCNHVSSYATIDNHINEDKHLFRKEHPVVTETASDVTRNKIGRVRYHEMVMSKFEWHGVINNRCILCKTIIENVDHIKQADHMISLIQSKITINNDNRYVRKIDNNTDFCYCCNNFYTPSKNPHEHESVHTVSGTKDQAEKKDASIEERLRIPKFDKNYVLRKLRKFFYINEEKNCVRCIQCKLTLPDMAFKPMILHRKSHKMENEESDSSDPDNAVNTKVADRGKRRSELANYGLRHKIKLNSGGSKGYCSLCDVLFSADINVAKQHVRGTRHQGLLLAKGIKKGIRYDKQITYLPDKTPLHDFIKEATFGEGLNVICINTNLCVDIQSFLFVVKTINDEMKCLVCNKIMKIADTRAHCSNKHHKEKVMAASVVIIDYDTDLVNEFVREVQKDIYHCGFCNQLIPFWDPTYLHLKTEKHIKARKSKEGIMNGPLKIYFVQNSVYVASISGKSLIKKLIKLNIYKGIF